MNSRDSLRAGLADRAVDSQVARVGACEIICRTLGLWLLLVAALSLTACGQSPQQFERAPTPQATVDARSGAPNLAAGPSSGPLAPDQPARFGHLSLEQGLSQSSVFCILQDSKGFLWACTQDGLNKYDGYGFTIYRPIPDDDRSLSDGYILSLYEGQERTLWIGTYGGGLNSLDLDTGEITRYPVERGDSDGLAGGVVTAITQDRQGALWLGTNRGLNRYDPESGRFTLYEQIDGESNSLSHSDITAVFLDRDGAIWIGTEGGGLGSFDPHSEQFTHYQRAEDDPHSLSSNFVTAIFQDSDDTLWIGTGDAGLDRFESSTGRFIHYSHDPDDLSSLSSNSVTALHEDQFGLLWIGTENQGLNRFDPETETFTHFRHDPRDPNSLSDNWISSLYRDRAGILWIGTLGSGLSNIGCPGASFIHYHAIPYAPDTMGSDVVWSIHEDREGALWIGTFGAGLDRYDRDTGQWRHYRHQSDDPDSLSHDVVRAVVQDTEGMLWIGTDGGGLDRLDPETERFTHYPHDPDDPGSLSDNAILTLYVDWTGTLWVGTRNGLNELDSAAGRFTRYRLGNNAVRAIHRDSKNRLWVGTGGGIYRLDLETGKQTVFRAGSSERDGLSSDSILSITEDAQGVIWVGTFGGGLNRLEPGAHTFTHYRQSEGLPSDVVYGILEDDHGYLWLSTNAGLSKFDPATAQFTNYGVADGLQSKEFNAGAFHKSSSGEMFFGGVNGFNAFYPNSVKRNLTIPPVVLTKLKQGGTVMDTENLAESTERVTFRWPDNFFEFEFAALNYCQPERNQYAYMLVGLDKDWLHIGTQRTGRYTNLPGKTYTLRIKGSNNDGLWNDEGASLTVKVVPPFWTTWWFQGIAILAVVAAVVVGYRLRVRSIEARSRDLELQVAERTRTLAERTRETERRKQELEALYRVDAELHRHLSLDKVLQALVDIAVDILQADKSSLLAWDDERKRLVVRVARGYLPETLAQMSYAPDQGTVGRVASTCKPVAVKDARTDPRVSKQATITEPEGIRSFMQVPIEIGGEVFGVFSADYVRPRAFGNEEKRLFLALAQRAALAIDTAQLHEQSQELAVVEERNRLARDLHDAVTQTLFSSSLIAEALPELWESDQAEGRELLRDLKQLSRGALAEMRTLLLELRPAALAETPLRDLLRQLCDAATGRTGVPVSMSADGQCSVPSEVHVALYRIAQEALNNVVKHSQASQVAVGLRCIPPYSDGLGRCPRQVELRVSDNGRGFDPDLIPSDRLGLGIIHERAQAIGAEIEILSQTGQGTAIVVMWKANQKDNGAAA
jgi:ligand-binding sensor domain-containing protein/signal transduction histidine kinase